MTDRERKLEAKVKDLNETCTRFANDNAQLRADNAAYRHDAEKSTGELRAINERIAALLTRVRGE